MSKKYVQVQFLTSKIPKKESKLNQNWKRGSARERANHTLGVPISTRHFPSADWHNFEAQPGNALINLKHIYFKFFEIRTQPNSYLIPFSLFFKHQTSINRGKKSEIGAFLFLTSLLPLR